MTDNTDNTDVVLFGLGKISLSEPESFAAALEQSAADDPRAISGGDYISFSGKTGRYSIGIDKEDSDPEEPMLVVMPQSQNGWICWKGGKPVEKRMVSINAEPIAPPDPTDHGPFNANSGEGWYKAKALTLYSLDRGVTGLFTNNSTSGVSEISKLQKESAERLREGRAFWPVVGLTAETFSAQGQTNYKPIFDQMIWLTTEQVNELAAASDTETLQSMFDRMWDAGEQYPVAGITVDASVDAEPEPKPARRRRRAAV